MKFFKCKFMDVAFTTVCQIGYAGLVSVKSMKYCCVFLFMREIDNKKKHSVVENVEQHP